MTLSMALYEWYTCVQHVSSLQKCHHLAFHIHSHLRDSMWSLFLKERSSSLVCKNVMFIFLCRIFLCLLDILGSPNLRLRNLWGASSSVCCQKINSILKLTNTPEWPLCKTDLFNSQTSRTCSARLEVISEKSICTDPRACVLGTPPSWIWRTILIKPQFCIKLCKDPPMVPSTWNPFFVTSFMLWDCVWQVCSSAWLTSIKMSTSWPVTLQIIHGIHLPAKFLSQKCRLDNSE
jgi:hypothetical protein